MDYMKSVGHSTVTCHTPRPNTQELFSPSDWMPQQAQSGTEGTEDSWRVTSLQPTLEARRLSSDISERIRCAEAAKG